MSPRGGRAAHGELPLWQGGVPTQCLVEIPSVVREFPVYDWGLGTATHIHVRRARHAGQLQGEISSEQEFGLGGTCGSQGSVARALYGTAKAHMAVVLAGHCCVFRGEVGAGKGHWEAAGFWSRQVESGRLAEVTTQLMNLPGAQASVE